MEKNNKTKVTLLIILIIIVVGVSLYAMSQNTQMEQAQEQKDEQRIDQLTTVSDSDTVASLDADAQATNLDGLAD